MLRPPGHWAFLAVAFMDGQISCGWPTTYKWKTVSKNSFMGWYLSFIAYHNLHILPHFLLKKYSKISVNIPIFKLNLGSWTSELMLPKCTHLISSRPGFEPMSVPKSILFHWPTFLLPPYPRFSRAHICPGWLIYILHFFMPFPCPYLQPGWFT